MDLIFSVEVPFGIKEEGGQYISYCPVLDVYSQGSTKHSAQENLVEALQLFLISCYERGTLQTVLNDSGFSPAADLERAEIRQYPNLSSITVPLPFELSDSRLSQCLA